MEKQEQNLSDYQISEMRFPRVMFRLKRYEYDEFDKIAEAAGVNNVNKVVQELVRCIINPDIAPTQGAKKIFKQIKNVLITG